MTAKKKPVAKPQPKKPVTKKVEKVPEDKPKKAASSISNTLLSLAKKFGGGTIVSATQVPNVYKIPTGNLGFDFVTTGGIPVNRITEVFGDYSSLKTLHAILAMASFQRQNWADRENGHKAINRIEYKFTKHVFKEDGEEVEHTIAQIVNIIPRRGYKQDIVAKRVAFVDYEGTFDKVRAKALGVDLEGLLYICPATPSEGVDIIDALLSDPEICLVVIDSISAVGADSETDSSMEDQQMAANARFWNKAFRKFQAAINRNPEKDVTLFVINSAYEKVGMVFGDPTKVKNGVQLRLAKSMSIQHTALKEIPGKDAKGNDVIIGKHIKLKNVKNKTGRPLLETTFFFNYIDDPATGELAGTPSQKEQLVELGTRLGLVERAGSWFQYKDFRGQGIEGLIKVLIENDALKGLKDELYALFPQA